MVRGLDPGGGDQPAELRVLRRFQFPRGGGGCIGWRGGEDGAGVGHVRRKECRKHLVGDVVVGGDIQEGVLEVVGAS